MLKSIDFSIFLWLVRLVRISKHPLNMIDNGLLSYQTKRKYFLMQAFTRHSRAIQALNSNLLHYSTLRCLKLIKRGVTKKQYYLSEPQHLLISGNNQLQACTTRAYTNANTTLLIIYIVQKKDFPLPYSNEKSL